MTTTELLDFCSIPLLYSRDTRSFKTPLSHRPQTSLHSAASLIVATYLLSRCSISREKNRRRNLIKGQELVTRVTIISWLGDHHYVLVQSGIQNLRVFETATRPTSLAVHTQGTYTLDRILPRLTLVLDLKDEFFPREVGKHANEHIHDGTRTLPRRLHSKPGRLCILTDISLDSSVSFSTADKDNFQLQVQRSGKRWWHDCAADIDPASCSVARLAPNGCASTSAVARRISSSSMYQHHPGA